MDIKTLLNDCNTTVFTVRPEDTLETAATLLSSNNIGALPVRDAAGRLAGMLSERDIVRGFAEQGGKVHDLKVEDLMTRSVIECQPDEDVDVALQRMSQRHIRHLPVTEDGELRAMLSLRDLMEHRLSQTELEVNVLRDRAIIGR
ncbi:MAG: CBS domain-containing protein [Rhodospirillales bacterium]|nr:CBS domain-containing protein [Rhodospirillales bacterium]